MYGRISHSWAGRPWGELACHSAGWRPSLWRWGPGCWSGGGPQRAIDICWSDCPCCPSCPAAAQAGTSAQRPATVLQDEARHQPSSTIFTDSGMPCWVEFTMHRTGWWANWPLWNTIPKPYYIWQHTRVLTTSAAASAGVLSPRGGRPRVSGGRLLRAGRGQAGLPGQLALRAQRLEHCVRPLAPGVCALPCSCLQHNSAGLQDFSCQAFQQQQHALHARVRLAQQLATSAMYVAGRPALACKETVYLSHAACCGDVRSSPTKSDEWGT